MLKVFIADDEESIRNGLKKIIDWKDCGYSICGEAGNGQEAFEKISELNPDLVLLDIKMPGLTGVEVLKKIAEQNAAEGLKSKTNFLILSGFSDFEFAKEAMNYGAQGYFVKPIDEDLLEEKVRSIAEHFSQVKEIPKSEDIKRRFEQMFLFGVAEDAFEDDYEDENDYQVALFSSKRSGYEGRISDFEKRIADTFSNMDMFTVAYEEDVAAVFKNCKEDAVYRMLERFAQRLSKNPFAVLGSKKRGVNGALASFMECRREVPALFFADDGKEIPEVNGSRRIFTQQPQNNSKNVKNYSTYPVYLRSGKYRIKIAVGPYIMWQTVEVEKENLNLKIDSLRNATRPVRVHAES